MECAAVREFTGVHDMIRGMMRLMESAVSKAKPDDAKQMKVLSHFGLFAVAGTHFHHSAEDDHYWPAVVRNGADASALEPLVKEHQTIDPLLTEAQRAFESLSEGSIDAQAMESLGGLVDRFKNDMLTHLDNEEPIFFPLRRAICRTMSLIDWQSSWPRRRRERGSRGSWVGLSTG